MAISTASYAEHDSSKGGTADYTHYHQGGGMRVTATFGPDGRLWRIVPVKRFIYVDYSTDLGKSFSTPVRINRQPQHIKASRQNRPDIAVDHSGRITGIYTADSTQPMTQFFSKSTDNGRSFSIPIPLSKAASKAISMQGRVALSPSGQVYAFWLDERDRTDWRQPGYAMYSTIIDSGSSANLVNLKLADACANVVVLPYLLITITNLFYLRASFIQTTSVIMVFSRCDLKEKNHFLGALSLINGSSEAARNMGLQFLLVTIADTI